jgi:hypothetical protein
MVSDNFGLWWTRAADNLINAVLDYSRVGRLKLKEPVDVGKC